MPNQDQNNTDTNGTVVPRSSIQPASGSFSKEGDMPHAGEPMLQEVVEYEVPKEVASHVAKVQEHIEVPPDLKNIGVSTPHSHGKVSDTLQKELKFPLTDDEIGAWRKGDPKFNGTWLAAWCYKQLLKAGYYLKQIGDHSVRAKKPAK